MMKLVKELKFNDLLETLNKNKRGKYIIDYEIVDKRIKVKSSEGEYRFVKNTKSNIRKINKAIVENKVKIARKIDAYENESTDRLMVLLFNIAMISLCGIFTGLSFFVGSLPIFIFSIISFSLCVLATTISGANYYILASEIKRLKKLTGYKQNNEFEFKLGIRSH